MKDWIELDDRYPEEDEQVLLWISQPFAEYAIGAWMSGDGGWSLCSGTRSGLAADVIAWMPLPQPPTVGK